MKKIGLIGFILFAFPSFGEYQNPSLKEFLSEFHKNPYKVMNQSPYKSKKIKEFSISEITNKISSRKKLTSFQLQNKEEFFGINGIYNLFQGSQDILKNAFEIDEKPLKTVKLVESPWSGYYWSMANGLLGYRYADRKFNRNSNWQDRFEFVTENPMSSYLDERKIEVLSPSEKYDLLIGNYNAPTTSAMWEEGKKEIAQYQKIRDWSGLCHGLAMASLQFPWPKYSIKLRSADGKHLIKFYPEDIKALGIYHWGADNIPLRKLGGRCELVSPRSDSNGRIKDPNCRDPNPGAFHLALINRLGVQKKSLIMDSSMDAEVWNYPIVGYSFSFFNLNSGTRNFKLKNSMIPLSDYTKDKFSEHRSQSAEFIVGVETKIEYLTHKGPAQNDKDPSSNSSLITVFYRYDLELDSTGNIIGGEWYTNRIPDFIWFPEDSADPRATFDHMIQSSWDPSKEILPIDWKESANSSAEKGQVSGNIIKALFQYSNKGSN